jgi:hypothetical protein
MIFILIFSACSTREDTDVNTTPPISNSDELPTFQAEVIETGDYLLVAPNEDTNEARSSDKISVSLLNAKLVNKEGTDINLDELLVGDILIITYDGAIMESYPAQITASKVELIDHNNLLDGYLALIDDIYQMDNGLNGEIEMIAFDTSQWINLTNIGKEIIFAQVKESYGFEVIEGTYEELVEQELIEEENLYFPKGILIKLSNMEYNKDKEKITCAISKWRSGLGAIGSEDVTAEYDGTQWKISKEGMWIS